MLDINLIKENPEKIKESLLKKGWEFDPSKVIELDKERRDIISSVENMKAEKNSLSSSVGKIKKEGGDVEHIFEKVKELNGKIEKLDGELKEIESKIITIIEALPNIPDEDLLAGEKENNKVIKVFGEKPKFEFKPLDHMELCEKLGIVDYERAAKISGRGTCIYKGLGARLEWALINLFIDEHLSDGYEFILPPHMLNYESGYTAGQFPKFVNDVFWLDDGSNKRTKFILPTAETALVNIHRNEIMNESDLPKKYFAYTPCYRNEAGSYRTEERGMIRGFQFNKVEMVQYTTPETSDEMFYELVGKAERILEKLGLHYHTSKLAAGDCSHSMARTYDIEIWIPSMQIYKEVSSSSNARDYQARRGNIKFRDSKTGKTRFVHTLNASGLATSRLFPALLEQCQNEDGSVTIPEVLRKYMGGIEKIMPIK